MGAEKREECCSPDPEWKTCGDCTPCGKCSIKGTVLLVVSVLLKVLYSLW